MGSLVTVAKNFLDMGPPKAPTITFEDSDEPFSFHAVTDTTFLSDTDTTEYPIEAGFSIPDHIIFRPKLISMTIRMSNKPYTSVAASAGQFASGIVSNAVDFPGSSVVTGAAGGLISSAFDAGDESEIPESTLARLIALQESKSPVDVDIVTWSSAKNSYDSKQCVLILKTIDVKSDVESEGELVAKLTFKEILTGDGTASKSTTDKDDPASTQNQDSKSKGEVVGKDVTDGGIIDDVGNIA